jgi:hypothetical protein
MFSILYRCSIFRLRSNTACFGFIENKGRREISAPFSIVVPQKSKPVRTDAFTRHNKRVSVLRRQQRRAALGSVANGSNGPIFQSSSVCPSSFRMLWTLQQQLTAMPKYGDRSYVPTTR